MPHSEHRHEAELGTAALNAQSVDDEKVASAIKTDFILSAEIMAIKLAAIPAGSLRKQALVLALVSPGFSNGWWRPPSRVSSDCWLAPHRFRSQALSSRRHGNG